MKLVRWMAGASVVSWLAAAAVVGHRQAGLAIFWGMAGPLVVASATWVFAERTYRRDPARLTPFMLTAFVGKLVFFGAYVAIVLRVLSVPVRPFVTSFTSYFIALYVMEALGLRRLFEDRARASR